MTEAGDCGSSKSNKNCSVVGCHFTYKNCSPGTKFFSFPNDKQHAIRRRAWIIALGRDKSWTPSKHSRVCSRHFVNGTPTREPDSPGYIPRLLMNLESRNLKDADGVVRFRARKVRHSTDTTEHNSVELPSRSKSAMEETLFIKCEPSTEESSNYESGSQFLAESIVEIKTEPNNQSFKKEITEEYSTLESVLQFPTESKVEIKTEPNNQSFKEEITEEHSTLDLKDELDFGEYDSCRALSEELQPAVLSTTANSERLEGESKSCDRKESTEGRKLCCCCGMAFANRMILDQHKLTHRDKPSSCLFCGTKPTLKALLEMHDEGRNHQCSLCEKTCTTKHLLSQHMKTHAMLTCGKDSNLSTHEKHMDYNCSVCNKTFMRKSALRDHIVSHMNDRYQVCSFCGKI